MKSSIEKVTLSLDRGLLEKLAGKARKSMSEFVRDLIHREESIEIEDELIISKEIRELKGGLQSSNNNTKERVHQAAKNRLRKL